MQDITVTEIIDSLDVDEIIAPHCHHPVATSSGFAWA